MKGRVIVLDKPKDRGFAAALVVDGRLEDLQLSPLFGEPFAMVGSIDAAKITRVLPNGNGAFCETEVLGDGFLRDARGVGVGERHLVQVISFPEAGKAATMGRKLVYKGPRLILTPGAPGINVSRRIGNEAERERLKDAVDAARSNSPIPVPEDVGTIVRTEARGEDAGLIAREYGALLSLAVLHADQLKSGNAVAGTEVPLSYALREWVLPLPDQIVVSPELATVLSETDPERGPHWFHGDERCLSRMSAEHDPFTAMNVRDAIDALTRTEIALEAGSTMFMEATHALVAVDVNTKGDFSPAAGLKANLAAARDLPRQLRLRGLGGQVIVDFAPMPKQHRKTLEEALKKAFRADPVETSLVGWTRLGLYEMQRKRERLPLSEVL